MTAVNNQEPKIKISNDNMQVYLRLPTPVLDHTEWDISGALKKSGVIYGIDEKKIQKILEQPVYEQEILVAEGNYVSDGTDGYYEYKFNLDFSKKPKMRPDGTVDYWSIKMIETVSEGQVIAIYHKAVQGKDGMDIKGKVLIAKRARDLVPLRGKGFSRSEDGTIYTSLCDGKIERTNDRITILPIYEIYGDVDLSIGNIDFWGDVVIHGGVCTGVKIKATGSITVDGIVEGAQIEAGKDIVLRSGVVGSSRACITSKSNIIAKFFEYTRVHANGTIRADSFVNCKVSCGENIILDGKQAKIVGGEVWAIQGIATNVIGSDGEVNTHIRIGNNATVLRRISILKSKIRVEQENLDKIEDGLKLVTDIKNDSRRSELLRLKIRDRAFLSDDTAELDKLENQIERAKGGSIKVIGSVYPGVTIEIDEQRIQVREEQGNMEFVKNKDKIVMCALEYR
ncbi:MAG: FapA family protein [Lachnospiraceae bacterium]